MTLANVKNRCRICFTILKDPNNGKLSDYYSIHTLRRITVTGGYVADLISYNDLLQKFMPFVEHQQSPLHPSDGDDGHHIADHDNRISSAPPLHSDIVCLNCSEMLSKMFTFHSIFQRLLITLKEKYRRTLRIVNNWAGCHNQQQQHAIDESSGLPVLAAPKKRRCSSNGTNAVDNRTNNPSNNNNNPSENDIETGHASTRSCGPSSRRKGEPRHHLPTSSNATYPTNQSRNSPIASSKKRFRSACADNNEFARIKLLDEIGFNGAVDELAFEFNHHHHQRRQFDSFADEGDSRTAKANNLNRIAASLMVDRNAVDRDDTTSSATNLSEPVPIIHQQQQNNRSKSNKRRSPLISNRSPSSNHRGMTIASLVQSPPPSSSNPFIMSSPLNVSTNAAIASTSSNNMDVPTSAAIVAIEERLNQSPHRQSTKQSSSSHKHKKVAIVSNAAASSTYSISNKLPADSNAQKTSIADTTSSPASLTTTQSPNPPFHSRQSGNFKRYECGYCGKIVTNIQIHVRRHTNDKPYCCEYCSKRFTNSGDLQIHTRIHTGEKPYGCPLCGKSYRTIGNFNSHVKTHDTGERPHRCILCNDIFEETRDWFSHLRSNHKFGSSEDCSNPPIKSTAQTSAIQNPSSGGVTSTNNANHHQKFSSAETDQIERTSE